MANFEQLVGTSCTSCRGRISSIIEAEFCRGCGNPIHFKCRDPKHGPDDPLICSQCGANKGRAIDVGSEAKRSVHSQKAPGSRILIVIASLHFIALIFFVLGGGLMVWLFWRTKSHDADREVILMLLGISLCMATFIEIVAFGLRKGQSWARGPAIAILLLSILSIALPAALIGFLFLTDGRSWKEYRANRVKRHDTNPTTSTASANQ